MIIGAYLESSDATGANGVQANNNAVASGAAYVFERSGATWSQQAYLKASNSDPGDLFGSSVSLSGDRLIVSALGEDGAGTGVNASQLNNNAPGAGSAYVFARAGGVWSQEAYLKASQHAGGLLLRRLRVGSRGTRPSWARG